MKHLKALGLVAAATMALMAFIGIGSASATVLCKTSITQGCAASGWDYPTGTTIDASLEGTAIHELHESTMMLDTCSGSTFKGSTSNTGNSSETVLVPLAAWTWSGCTRTTNTLKAGKLEIHWIAGTDNGTLTAFETEITTNTIFGSCVYGFGNGHDIGILTGGNPATIDINTTVTKITGNFACPEVTTLTAAYPVTEPSPLYVATS